MSLPMRTKDELINEIEDRNKARAEAGLPSVSVPKEIEKISEAELRQDFCDWCEARQDLWDTVAEEVLQTFRKERGDPTWVPLGLLNGAWAYGSQIQDRMHQIWKEETGALYAEAAEQLLAVVRTYLK
jgi:hypothetical protein